MLIHVMLIKKTFNTFLVLYYTYKNYPIMIICQYLSSKELGDLLYRNIVCKTTFLRVRYSMCVCIFFSY